MKDVNELRERLVEVWAGLQQNVIDDAIATSGADACVPAFGLQEDILSICCDYILATYRIWFVKFVENLLIYR